MISEKLSLDPYEAVLADLRAKRDQIDQTIGLLEAMRTGSAPARSMDFSADVGANGIVETAGMFLGMSIADAAKKLLNQRKRTMGNAEIASELKSGGLVMTGADPLNVVGSVLTRRFNNVGDIVRVGRGVWGLKEWYPGRTFKPTMKMLQTTSDPDEVAITPEQEAMMKANVAAIEAAEASIDDMLG